MKHPGIGRFSGRMAVLLIGLLLTLTGCDASSGEKQIYPICMSMDRLEDGRLQLAVQVSSMGGDSGESVFAAAGKDFEQTLEILGASMPYPLHFGQLRLCILGYGLASDCDLETLLDPLFQLYTINPDAAVMVAMGSAAETMAAQTPDLGVRLSTYLDQLLARLRQEHLTPPETLRDILVMLKSGYRDPLLGLCAINQKVSPESSGKTSDSQQKEMPAFSHSGRIAIGEPAPGVDLPPSLTAGAIPRTGGNPVEYIGCVPVGNGRAAGTLTATHTRMVLTLRQYTQIQDVTDADATIVLSSKAGITPQVAAEVVTILQQMHCDALGVTAAAARKSGYYIIKNNDFSKSNIARMTLTITRK